MGSPSSAGGGSHVPSSPAASMSATSCDHERAVPTQRTGRASRSAAKISFLPKSRSNSRDVIVALTPAASRRRALARTCVGRASSGPSLSSEANCGPVGLAAPWAAPVVYLKRCACRRQWRPLPAFTSSRTEGEHDESAHPPTQLAFGRALRRPRVTTGLGVLLAVVSAGCGVRCASVRADTRG